LKLTGRAQRKAALLGKMATVGADLLVKGRKWALSKPAMACQTCLPPESADDWQKKTQRRAGLATVKKRPRPMVCCIA
jgi:hypothetical protein